MDRNIKSSLYLVFALITSGCSIQFNSAPEGIWHTEFENVPGQLVDIEFEVRQSLIGGDWSGRWEILELMISGNLFNVQVTDSLIEMDLTKSLKFRGSLSEDGGAYDGILYNSGEEIPQIFTRVDDWTSRRPARWDEKGRPVKKWNYRLPELIDDKWPVASLIDANINPQPIDNLIKKVLDGKYQGLDALLVARGGNLVLEEYFHFGNRDEIHQIQSITKSVTSLLIGIAYDEGFIRDLEQPVYEFFPTYSDSIWVKEKYPISLKNTLMMSAGLDWRENGVAYTNPLNDAIRMNTSGDMYGYVLSRERGQSKYPGEKFEYTSGLSILLGGIVLEETGMPIDKYAEQTLFKQLGIENFYWSNRSGQVHTGGGLSMEPRDLLKLGQLVLDNGRWNGKQVISESWIKESTRVHLPVENSREYRAYGYQWWQDIFHVGRKSYPAIYASGYGWQMLWIIPELEMVVLVLHHNPSDGKAEHSLNWNEVEKVIIPAALTD
jgi:CubicO group peptidase (beta-lactamase class C family)